MSRPITGYDALVSEPVTLINVFTVPPEESERFLDRWTYYSRIMVNLNQPGFIRARLYRSLSEDAELRFINVVEWDSGTALDAAHANPEWRTSIQQLIEGLHITARPAVYQVAVDVHPDDPL